MNNPTIKLMFIRNAFTPQEGPLEVIASYSLQPHAEREGFWAMRDREVVTFPTGDVLEIYTEVNPASNCVHINHGAKRLVSWKAASDVNLMFLLPSGEEAYVELTVHGKLT